MEAQSYGNQKPKPDSLEREMKCEPKIIFNGDCDHEYVHDYIDSEGKKHYQCVRCPMGRFNLGE